MGFSFISSISITSILRYPWWAKNEGNLIVLPALLFRQLAFFKPDLEVVRLSVYFVAVEVIVFVISYLIGRHLLVMPRRSLGVFSLCSTFGSTGILGTAFIAAVFNGDPNAVGKGLLISQLAVGIPANIVCPLVTLWTGDRGQRSPATLPHAPTIIDSIRPIDGSDCAWHLLEPLGITDDRDIHQSPD